MFDRLTGWLLWRVLAPLLIDWGGAVLFLAGAVAGVAAALGFVAWVWG